MVLETRELQFKSLVTGEHFGNSPTLSLLPPSSKAEPTTLPKNQLTIFYAGSVNVYDDIPEDKAHAIMLLAGNATAGNMNQLLGSLGCMEVPGSNPSANPPNVFTEPAQKVRKVQPMSTPSYQNGLLLSLNSHYVRPFSPKLTTKVACPPVPSQSLPQARKASLTRFLQRRKERAVQQSMESAKEEKTCSEYSDFSAKSQDCSTVQEGHSTLNKDTMVEA